MAKARTVDEYLAGVEPIKRAALAKLRAQIRKATPKAEERIAYGLAAYYLNGHPLVAFAAFKAHCSFFPMSGHTIAKHAKELAKFETQKGTVRFTPEKPLRASLVAKIVRERAAEIAARWKH